LHVQSRVERDDLAGTSHSGIIQQPGAGMIVPDCLVMGAAGIGLIAA